ncbi:MAG: AAA family ATPase [candidate division WOR-3 bacterium]
MKQLSQYRSSVHFLIIGKPGTGKTYSLLTLPRPLLIIDAEGGLSTLLRSEADISNIMYENVTDFDELRELLRSIDYNKFKSIAIDTISGLQSFHTMKRYMSLNRENLPFSEWNYILVCLKNLFYEMKQHNIIFVVNVHERVDTNLLAPSLQGQSATEIFMYVDFAFRSVYLNGEYLWKIKGENEPLKFRGKAPKEEYVRQNYTKLLEAMGIKL